MHGGTMVDLIMKGRIYSFAVRLKSFGNSATVVMLVKKVCWRIIPVCWCKPSTNMSSFHPIIHIHMQLIYGAYDIVHSQLWKRPQKGYLTSRKRLSFHKKLIPDFDLYLKVLNKNFNSKSSVYILPKWSPRLHEIDRFNIFNLAQLGTNWVQMYEHVNFAFPEIADLHDFNVTT